MRNVANGAVISGIRNQAVGNSVTKRANGEQQVMFVRKRAAQPYR